MTNVVDVYVNYLRWKVDAGYDRQLIRTPPTNGSRKAVDDSDLSKKAPRIVTIGALF